MSSLDPLLLTQPRAIDPRCGMAHRSHCSDLGPTRTRAGAVKLSIFSHNYAPEPTGIPYYNTLMAEWFARAGHQVTVHTGLPHYPWWRVPDEYARKDYRRGRSDEVRNGVKVERVSHFVPRPPLSGMSRMRLDASYLSATLRRRARARTRPDLILLVAPPFLIGLLGLLLRWRWFSRVPVVYHVQDLQVDAALELNMLPRLLGRTMLAVERYILSRVDLVTTVSEGMRRRIAAKTRTVRPVELFPNWTDVHDVYPVDADNPYRREWGVARDEVVVGYSGNLGRKQGLDILIQAIAFLDGLSHVRFIIAGEGADQAELKSFALKRGLQRLRFLPLAPAERLRDFLSAIDVHCVPQRKAAADLVMPSKMLNIMAVARPVVVTAGDDTELARLVRSAECGLVVPPEDPQALAEAIRKLVGDAPLRLRMGPAGRAHVRAHLDIETVLPRFARRLQQLIRNSH